MITRFNRFAMSLAAFVFLGLFPGILHSQDLTRYELRTASFSVPSDWTETMYQRDQEYDFQSPDKKFELWVRWWFPDEPLLGGLDMTRHQKITLAGQDALFLHIGPENSRMLQLAFLEPDEEGEQLLFQLIGHDVSLAEHEAMFDRLTRTLSVKGLPVELILSAAEPAPDPAPGGALLLPLPEGWTGRTLEHAELDLALRVSPDGDAMVLAAVALEGNGVSADAQTDEFLGLLYRDSMIVKSIEGEGFPEIAGTTAHQLQTISKVFDFFGTQMPYARGKLDIYQGGDAARAFMIVSVQGIEADPSMARQIQDMVLAMSFDGTAAPAPTAIVPAASSDPAALPGQEWLAVLNQRFGGDCVLLPQSEWLGPDHRILKQADVTVTFNAECGPDLYLVYGVEFRFDPRGATGDYFYPLYANYNAATLQYAFSFIELRDNLLIDVTVSQDDKIAVQLTDLPAPERAFPAAGPSIVATGDAETAVSTVLFDGHGLENWETFEFEGGEFEKHARLGDGMLLIEFAEDQWWAKTGLRTKEARVTMPVLDDAEAQVISITLDADRSTGFAVAFSPEEAADEDPRTGHNYQLVLEPYEGGMVRAALTTRPDHKEERRYFPWPKGVTTFEVVLRPDQVVELRLKDGRRLAWFDLDRNFGGRSWVLQVFAQVPGKNQAGGLALHEVRLEPTPVAQLPDIDGYYQIPRQLVLFDGLDFEPVWTFMENPGTPSEKFARLSDGALRVGWPEGEYPRELGMYSQQPVLWLDEFGPKAVARIRVELDGTASADFELGLKPDYSNPDQALSNGDYFASFRRQPDGSFLFQTGIRTRSETLIEQAGLSSVPNTLALVLTSRGIAVEADGLPGDPVPLDALQDGAGLRMWLYATRPETGSAALVVRRIETEYTPGPKPSAATAITDVDPLPQSVIFAGQQQFGWTAASAGSEAFEDLAQWSANGLVLRRTQTPANSHRIALMSDEPVVVLDHRIKETAFETQFRVIPDQDNFGMRILFSTWANNEDKGTTFALSLRNASTGAGAGRLRATLHADHFHYNVWTRLMPRGWETSWDGSVTVGFEQDRIYVRLGGTRILAAKTENSRLNKRYHVVVQPGGLGIQGGQVTLQDIRSGWQTPAAMDPLERLLLVDTDDFDPNAFADLLAQEVLAR